MINNFTYLREINGKLSWLNDQTQSLKINYILEHLEVISYTINIYRLG